MMHVIEMIDTHEGFISAVLAIVTAAIAICVPNFIASEQNKIALFDKRFEKYQEFLALKEFSDCIKEVISGTSQIKDYIYSIQQKYLDVHNVLAEERYIRYRYDQAFRNIAVFKSLEKDTELFKMIPLLLRIKNEEAIIETNKVFKEIIFEVFNSPEKMSADKILELGQEFVEKFSNIEFIENEFVKRLQLQNRRWRRMK